MNGLIEDVDKTELVGRMVTFEIAPGIVIEGIEVEV